VTIARSQETCRLMRRDVLSMLEGVVSEGGCGWEWMSGNLVDGIVERTLHFSKSGLGLALPRL